MYFDPTEKWGIVVISNGCTPRYAEGYNAVIRTVVENLYAGIIKTD
jgi:hypothetical protein